MHITSTQAAAAPPPVGGGGPLAIYGYVWSVLYDELPEASRAEADVTQALLAEAHVDGWLV